MLTTLLLAGLEKIVNLALTSDAITQTNLQALSGKTLRMCVQQPSFTVDVLFNDDHIRLEPAITQTADSPFETNYTTNPKPSIQTQPDCTLTTATLIDLLALLTEPAGNVPLDGDYKILMHCQTLLANFEPNFGDKLQPFIGVSMAGQVNILINYLKNLFSHTASKAMQDSKEWLTEDNAILAKRWQMNQLKQQLRDLQTDVEREQAKLDQLLAKQQENLTENISPDAKETANP